MKKKKKEKERESVELKLLKENPFPPTPVNLPGWEVVSRLENIFPSVVLVRQSFSRFLIFRSAGVVRPLSGCFSSRDTLRA